jgi:hypothetical protein
LNGHAVGDQPAVPLDRLAELVAQRLAPLLAEQLPPDRVLAGEDAHRGEGLVDIHEIARITGMSERWAYAHAREIGGVKAGDTKRARWRFDPGRALVLLAERNGEPATERGPRPERRELSGDAPLLPVRGRAA